MKKLLILMLSLLLVFSLVACSSSDTPDPSGTNNNDDPLNRDPGTSQTDNQGGTENQGGEDNSETQGGTQGQITPDDLVFEYDEIWQENEYTRLLPKPSFAIVEMDADENYFEAISNTATTAELRVYVEQLKVAGFNLNQESVDMEIMGTVVFTYIATNAEGYTVTIGVSAADYQMISVVPPSEQ